MEELMTLEEVANYLRVSERTIKEWASSGELPGGKLGSSWRFKKSDIENWLNKQLGSNNNYNKDYLYHDYSISTLMSPSNIFLTNCSTKKELLDFFIEKAYENISEITSRETLADAVFKRENLMSTGIGFGIAVPHIRLHGVKKVNVFMVVNKIAIMDYASLDNQPVRIGIFFVVGEQQHSEYIKSLSLILDKLKSPIIRQQVLEASKDDEIYKIMKDTQVWSSPGTEADGPQKKIKNLI